MIETQSAPKVGTAERLTGTYAIMMVDPDIPPRTEGGATSELLHWMQTDLVSANMTTTIGGMKVFELTNPSNVAAVASYIGPSPPNKSPQSHRYTQLLLRTDTNTSVSQSLARFGMTRANFSAANVVKSVGLNVLAGNSFNVTASSSTTGIGSGNSTFNSPQSSASSGSTSPGGQNSTSPKPGNNAGRTEGGAFIAVFGAFVAAVLIL